MTESRLAVSFGSSFLGFATHLGFLRGLIAAGHRPACVAGSSAGAIVAGLYASGLSLDEMEAAFTHPKLRGKFREWRTPFRGPFVLLGLPGFPALLKGVHLEQLLRDLVGDRRIEDCTTARLHIAVTNLRTNRVELRDRGPLIETMLASCALPGIIAPRKIGDELLWDGGLGSSVPVEQWIDDSAVTHIVAHSIIYDSQLRSRERTHRFNFAAAMLAGHQLTADELLRWKLELARRFGKVVVTAETISQRPRIGIPITLPPPKPWPDYARDLMALGAASARTVAATLSSAAEKPAANC